jgi:lysophospholipase L1-like esterase
MRKGLGVVAILVVYALGTWLLRQRAWAPPPLVSPDAVVALGEPLRREEPAQEPVAPLEASPVALIAPAPRRGIASHRWEGFLAKLRALEMGRRRAVRVVHLGDSELVADGPTRAIRQAMTARFGDGGPGFALVASPVRWHVVDGWRHHAPAGMVAYTIPHGKLVSGAYGPAGIAFEANAGAHATVDLEHRGEVGCTIRFSYGRRADGGRVRVLADAFPLFEAETEGSGLGVVETTRTPCPRRFELVTHDGPTRLYGYEVRYDQPGITWSTLGVLGAQLTHLDHYAEGALEEGLAALEPDLVVLNFGLNRAAGPYLPPESYADDVARVLARIRHGLPEAACLVIGPYPSGKTRDDGTVARVGEAVSRHQRAAAEREGCAFLDRFALSGGPMAAIRWATGHPRVLSGDYHHMTRLGAERMGQAVANVLLAQYDGTSLHGLPLSLEGR